MTNILELNSISNVYNIEQFYRRFNSIKLQKEIDL